MGVSSCSVKHFKDGKRDTADVPLSSQSRIATTEYSKQKDDALITEDKRVTVRKTIVARYWAHSATVTCTSWKVLDGKTHHFEHNNA
jgi:hypothetical protein